MKTPSRTFLRFSPVPLLGLILFPGTAGAGTLASYAFANASPTVQAADVTGSDASWSFTAATIGFGGGAQSAYVRTDGLGTTFDSGRYLTFTLSAAEGKVLNLTSLTFDFGGNTSTSGSATLSTEVRSSAGPAPFAAPLTLQPPGATTATHDILTTDAATRYSAFSVDLSGAEFQGLESVSFRLYVAASSQSTTRFLRFDNVSVEGAVGSSIPEPSAAALLAGATALGLVAAGRRRRVK